MRAVLDAILKRLITVGRLIVRWPDGKETSYSGPPGSGAEATIRLKQWGTVRRLVLSPALGFGECYMDRSLEPEGCSIGDVLDVAVTNLMANGNRHPGARLHAAWAVAKRRFDQYNPAPRARRNAAHHYDLNGRLYSLFLDRDRQYSCAYFPTGNETLDEAQAGNKRHIAAKLRL
ncbi:MAG: class I SAM-dependent methyltransferase, partial [Acetobacteraceae bacterium]